MEVAIMLAKPADAPDMAEIISRSWETAYKDIIPMEAIRKQNATRLSLFKRIITEENDSQYVIRAEGKTVGIMSVALPQKEDVEVFDDIGIDDSFYELHGIYLHPDVYRRGIGTQAIRFAEEKALECGKSNMILWVFAENTSAIRFYEACGYSLDGAVKYYVYGKKMKCVRMRKKLH